MNSSFFIGKSHDIFFFEGVFILFNATIYARKEEIVQSLKCVNSQGLKSR